jgi:L-cysteine desulfidase
MIKNKVLKILKKNLKPAMGCTEPVAIAVACATARKNIGGNVSDVNVVLSNAFYKNAFSARIPNTGRYGIDLAIALGIIDGNPDKELEFFNDISESKIEEAQKLIDSHLINTSSVETDFSVFVRINLKTDEGNCIVELSETHTNISYIEVNGKVLLNGKNYSTKEKDDFEEFEFAQYMKAILNLEENELAFFEDGIELNQKISEYGIEKKCGIGLGSGYKKILEKGIVCNNLVMLVRMAVAAASDARMGGAPLSVMSSCGSGNQGLTTFIPAMIIASNLERSKVELYRALAISNFVNAFAKNYLDKLAPICGAAITAGVGTVAAAVYLLGGNIKQMIGAMNGMIANFSGIVCDGAKESCSYKVSSACGEAVNLALLAVNDVYISNDQGILGKRVEDSFKNVALLSNEGMKNVNNVMIKILKLKNRRKL